MKNKILNCLIIILLIIMMMPLNVFAIPSNALETYSLKELEELSDNEILSVVKPYWSSGTLSSISYERLKYVSGRLSAMGSHYEASMIATDIAMDLINRTDDSVIDVNDWKPNKNEQNSKLNTIVGRIVGVIQVLGSVVSVLALALIGIRYMFASIEQKAKYKETAIAYVVGCVMLFAISNITSIIYQATTGTFGEINTEIKNEAESEAEKVIKEYQKTNGDLSTKNDSELNEWKNTINKVSIKTDKMTEILDAIEYEKNIRSYTGEESANQIRMLCEKHKELLPRINKETLKKWCSTILKEYKNTLDYINEQKEAKRAEYKNTFKQKYPEKTEEEINKKVEAQLENTIFYGQSSMKELSETSSSILEELDKRNLSEEEINQLEKELIEILY